MVEPIGLLDNIFLLLDNRDLESHHHRTHSIRVRLDVLIGLPLTEEIQEDSTTMTGDREHRTTLQLDLEIRTHLLTEQQQPIIPLHTTIPVTTSDLIILRTPVLTLEVTTYPLELPPLHKIHVTDKVLLGTETIMATGPTELKAIATTTFATIPFHRLHPTRHASVTDSTMLMVRA